MTALHPIHTFAAAQAVGVVKLTEQYLLDRYDFEVGNFEVPALAGPVAPKGEGGANLSAGHRCAPFRLGADGKPQFTDAQQQAEDLADHALAQLPPAIDEAAIKRAIRAASSPEDLAERLALLLGGDHAVYREVLERALFAADVLGYVQEAG